jgi:hypothetical protein
LDQDEEEFDQMQEMEEEDPGQILGPNFQNKTFTWDSPAVRRDLVARSRQSQQISPGQYFQTKCPALGNLNENISPDKRVCICDQFFSFPTFSSAELLFSL